MEPLNELEVKQHSSLLADKNPFGSSEDNRGHESWRGPRYSKKGVDQEMKGDEGDNLRNQMSGFRLSCSGKSSAKENEKKSQARAKPNPFIMGQGSAREKRRQEVAASKAKHMLDQTR